jgi:cellulose synthase/poly-beta-1,6-N-acetylglucosamine synthase-like glycosyltransferase
VIFAAASGLSLFLIVVFLTYLGTIMVPYLRRKQDSPGDANDFEWHIFVPARDEEAVIGTTIMRLRTDFPAVHVWIVDDDSDDQTARIVDDLAVDAHVHLVRRRRPLARTGKGDALNAAYHALSDWLPRRADRTKVIVGVVDADGELGSNALDYVAADRVFGDPVVGGAQIQVRMKNRNGPCDGPGASKLGPAFARYLVRMQDLEFVGSISAMQMLREKTGTVGLGGNGQFARLSVLDELAVEYSEPWHGALLEDFELGVHILLAGYQNRFVFDAAVNQEAVESLRRLIVQRTRWSQGAMQCSRLYLRKVLRSSRLSTAGTLEASYFLIAPWTQLFGVVYWPILYVLFGTAAFRYPGGPVSFLSNFWFLGVIAVVTGILPFAIWGAFYRRAVEPSLSRWRAWARGLGYTAYLYYTYPTIVRAITRLVLRRSGWAKTRRNAEVIGRGPIAIDS